MCLWQKRSTNCNQIVQYNHLFIGFVVQFSKTNPRKWQVYIKCYNMNDENECLTKSYCSSSNPKSLDIFSMSRWRKSTLDMDLRLRPFLFSSMWLTLCVIDASKRGKFFMFFKALGWASVLADLLLGGFVSNASVKGGEGAMVMFVVLFDVLLLVFWPVSWLIEFLSTFFSCCIFKTKGSLFQAGQNRWRGWVAR